MRHDVGDMAYTPGCCQLIGRPASVPLHRRQRAATPRPMGSEILLAGCVAIGAKAVTCQVAIPMRTRPPHRSGSGHVAACDAVS